MGPRRKSLLLLNLRPTSLLLPLQAPLSRFRRNTRFPNPSKPRSKTPLPDGPELDHAISPNLLRLHFASRFVTITTDYANSSKLPRPIYKLASSLQVPGKLSQAGSFSTSGSDPPDPEASPSSDSPSETSPIDAESSIQKPISLWPGTYHSLMGNRDLSCSRTESMGMHSKTPSQSRTSILYRLSSDLILREQYKSPWNKMRIGKILMLLLVLLH